MEGGEGEREGKCRNEAVGTQIAWTLKPSLAGSTFSATTNSWTYDWER